MKRTWDHYKSQVLEGKTEVPKAVTKGLQYVQAKVNRLSVRTLVDTGTTHNFVSVDEAKRLGITTKKEGDTIKAVNSDAKPICGVARNVKAGIGEWIGTMDLFVVLMNDFKLVLGLELLDKVNAFLMPFANSLRILDGGRTCMESTKRSAKVVTNMLSAMQFKKGFNKNELLFGGLQAVLADYKDVMPKELPKKLPPRREVDHRIELEPNAKPP